MNQKSKLPDSLQTEKRFYDWQEMTLSKIHYKLFGESNQQINVSLSKNRSTLTVVYGPPQIGKTTLILFMLGIDSSYKYEEKNVYELLRGSSEYGKSSTSTAILYEQSEDNYFYIDGKVAKSDSSVISLVDDVRKQVENNKFKKDFIHIAIPQKAFRENNTSDAGKIKYLDMPGVDSKNELEIPHVDAVYKQYLNLASVILIVCKANKINSLEDIADSSRKKIHRHWECYKRYIIVTLGSFTNETIENEYFFNEKKNVQLYDYIRSKLYTKLKEYLPECKSNLYCFDLGTSIESLKSEVSEEAFFEANETNNKMKKELIDDIRQHRGGELAGIIEDLKETITEDLEKNIKEIDEEIAIQEKNKEKLVSSNNNREKLQNLLESTKIQVIEDDLNRYKEILKKNSISFIRQSFICYSKEKLNDKCEDIKKILKEVFKYSIFLTEKKMALKVQENLFHIQHYIVQNISLNNNEDKSNLTNEDKKSIKALFDKRILPDIEVSTFSKKTRYDYLNRITETAEGIEFSVLNELRIVIDSYLTKTIEKLEKEKEIQNSNQNILDKNRKNANNKIKSKDIDINQLENRKKTIQMQRDEYLKYLQDYKNIAKESFQICKDLIVQEINSTKDENKKMELFLYLGAQELSYNKFVGEI